MSFKAFRWASEVAAPNPHAKLVLFTLADFADDNGKCWPAKGSLVERTGLSRSSVFRALADLEGAGLIEKTAGGRVITLSLAPQMRTEQAANDSVTLTPTVSNRHPEGVTLTPKPVKEPVKEPSSEPNGSGAVAPFASHHAEAWARIRALKAKGLTGVFGALLRDHKLEPGDLLPTIVRLEALGTPDPAGYLTAAAKRLAKGPAPPVEQVQFV